MLQVTKCQLSQVINATQLPAGRADVDCLNIRFKAQTKPELLQSGFHPAAFAGSGLYALSFDDYLIYLGSYLGSGKGGAFFTGNVLSSRIWTHVAAITMRGHRVHMSRKQLGKLAGQYGEQHPLIQQLLDAPDAAKLHKDAGCLAPLNRMAFAAEHWDIFSQPISNDLLNRFQLSYVRLSALPEGITPAQLKTKLLTIEETLIKELMPTCNSTHIVHGAKATQISAQAVSERLLTEMQNFTGFAIAATTGK